MMKAEEAVQERDWQVLHDRVTSILNCYGIKDAFRKGDYWLLDDNWGWEVQQLEFQNLDLFGPDIIELLQEVLAGYPKWSITVRVDVVGKEKEWPGMGLIIHPDEIIDELQREFLPPEFADRVFASAASSRFKMLVYSLPTGVETAFDWKDEVSYRLVAGFLQKLLGEPDRPTSSDPNRIEFYCLITREDVAAFDRFLEGMAGRYQKRRFSQTTRRRR